MTYDVVDNISNIITLPSSNLDKIFQVEGLIIADILSQHQESDGSITYNIGIGNLIISWTPDTIKFKFTPTGKFEGYVKNALEGESPLQQELENMLCAKITKTYKELL